MAKGTKVISSSTPNFIKGGSGKMFGKDSAGPTKAGTTAAGAGKGGGKFGKGGSGKMFGKQSASPKTPFITGKKG
jgi:hypothetical protein